MVVKSGENVRMPRVNNRSQSLIDTLIASRNQISQAVVESTYRDLPHLWDAYGERGRRLCREDMDYHLSYLIESIQLSDPSLFLSYLAWVKGLFAHMKLPENCVSDLLDRLRRVLRDMFPDEYNPQLTPYLDFPNDAAFAWEDSEPRGANQPLYETFKSYLQALIQGEKQTARQLILSAAEDGIPIQDIYLHVFQPAQREIGRLWYTRRISVAEEHYCTAVTQLIMAELYPYVFSTRKSGLRLVAACAQGELHEIGVRMVADFFEMEGWDTYYLGANMPNEDIIRTLRERRPDVLAVSATLSLRHSTVERLISEVRATPIGNRIKIIVGGVALGRQPDLCRKLGADAYGADAREALLAAERLLGPNSR
jgi:methanogenic corrinoid protein MtbC1